MRHLSSGLGLLPLLLGLLLCASFSLASGPPSFCKCTCFSNSTIIPLDPAESDSESTPSSGSLLSLAARFSERSFGLTPRGKKYRKLDCSDCTRKFCLGYDLPICEGAKEDDVMTTCFQRDSRKDQTIVFIFIIATGGLLTWAVLKPWVEKWVEAARERRSYMPVYENPQ